MKIKDKLAKLLATENITVRHSASAKTASFDVKNRVLVLPIWSSLSKGRIEGKLNESDATDVYDLLVGHEVGHALYTPYIGWEGAIDEGLNKNILNIVEDPRIEKLIKRKYPGLRKAFLSGYSSLMQLGFFGDNLDYSEESMNVLDRLNIHFKGGASLQVPFDDAELWMVEGIAACETWDDVVEITKKIMMAYSELLKQMPTDAFQPQGAFAGFDDSDMEGEWADEVAMPDGSETLDGDQIDVEDFDSIDHGVDDEASETMEEWNNRKTQLSAGNKLKDIFYIGLPKPLMKNVVVPHKIARNELTEILEWNLKRIAAVKESAHPHYHHRIGLVSKEIWQTEYNKFRTSSQKIINYMVKEFERKKAADEYKRTSIDKTGILNVTKLHEYKYSDDLFLKRSIVHDGKNHGLVFLLDWSASMHYHLNNTVKQLLSLVWFCNKVNIPFEVYAFTSSYYSSDWFDMSDCTKDEQALRRKMMKRERHLRPLFDVKHNDVAFDTDSGFKMLNMLSSRMSARELNIQALNLFSIGYSYDIGGRILELKQFELGSTPLVQALVCMQEIIPNFRDHHKLDKVNFICLTDGEANSSFTSVKNAHDPDLEKPAHRCVTPIPSSGRADVLFDDPKSRKTYHVNNVRKNAWRIYDGEEQCLFLLNLLKDRYDINTIGIFLDSGRTIGRGQLEKYLGWYSFNREAHKAARKQCRSDGFATVKTAGYDEYYLVPMGSIQISNETGLPLDDGEAADMKKGQLKTLFAKNQKKKFGNRIMVNRMMDLIA